MMNKRKFLFGRYSFKEENEFKKVREKLEKRYSNGNKGLKNSII